MELAQILLTVAGAGAVTVITTWWVLDRQARWRREDRKDRVTALLKAGWNEITHAMEDAQRGRNMGSLRTVEALMADVGYCDLTKKCRKAVEAAYGVCDEYRKKGLNAWNMISGEAGMKLIRQWIVACEALEVIADDAYVAGERERIRLPKLRPHHIGSLRRSLSGGHDGPPTPELDKLEQQIRDKGWLEV